jgi:hypothetical protein
VLFVNTVKKRSTVCIKNCKFMKPRTTPELVDRASPVDDHAAEVPPTKSDLSDVDKTSIQSSSPSRRSLFPRPPGIFPDAYPPNWTLSRVPTPGEPLAPADIDPAFRFGTPPKTTTKPAVARQRWIVASRPQPAEGMRPKTIARIELVGRFSDFPAVNANPPKFGAKGLQYPSGNPTGTSNCPRFDDKLRELVLCGISQTK